MFSAMRPHASAMAAIAIQRTGIHGMSGPARSRGLIPIHSIRAKT